MPRRWRCLGKAKLHAKRRQAIFGNARSQSNKLLQNRVFFGAAQPSSVCLSLEHALMMECQIGQLPCSKWSATAVGLCAPKFQSIDVRAGRGRDGRTANRQRAAADLTAREQDARALLKKPKTIKPKNARYERETTGGQVSGPELFQWFFPTSVFRKTQEGTKSGARSCHSEVFKWLKS